MIKTHHELLGEAYSAENGRATLISEGAKLGIEADTIDQILQNAYDTAKQFGIDPVVQLAA